MDNTITTALHAATKLYALGYDQGEATIMFRYGESEATEKEAEGIHDQIAAALLADERREQVVRAAQEYDDTYNRMLHLSTWKHSTLAQRTEAHTAQARAREALFRALREMDT